jgi:hypothetical protein
MNNVDVPEGAYCKNTIIGQSCRFDESMYDWDLKDIEDYIDKKSDNDFLYIEFSYKQLGRDEEWFRKQCKALNQNLLLIKREILLEWTKATDDSVYSEETLELIESHMVDVKARLCFRKYYFLDLLRDDIDFLKPYVISCDVATGMELDASTICIQDPLTFTPVAEMRENKISTDDFAKVIYEIVAKFFVNSMVVIENNLVSKHMIDWLEKSPISNRLYYEYNIKEGQRIEERAKEKVFVKTKKKTRIYGVITSSATRPLMFDILDETIAESPECLATKNIYTDIKHLERHKGKIEHADGYHDDCLFAYLLGRYVLAYGKNLGRFLMPVAGRDHKDRKTSIARQTHELTKANINDKYEYHGLADDIIEEEKFFEAKKKHYSGKRTSFYMGIANIDQEKKFDKFGRIGHDM